MLAGAGGELGLAFTIHHSLMQQLLTQYLLLLLSRFSHGETGISGNFVGRIKGAKCPFDLQFLTWDFS